MGSCSLAGSARARFLPLGEVSFCASKVPLTEVGLFTVLLVTLIGAAFDAAVVVVETSADLLLTSMGAPAGAPLVVVEFSAALIGMSMGTAAEAPLVVVEFSAILLGRVPLGLEETSMVAAVEPPLSAQDLLEMSLGTFCLGLEEEMSMGGEAKAPLEALAAGDLALRVDLFATMAFETRRRETLKISEEVELALIQVGGTVLGG